MNEQDSEGAARALIRDKRLVDEVRASGPGSDRAVIFAGLLREFGMGTLLAMASRKELFAQLSERGVSVGPLRSDFTAQQEREIIRDAVLKATESFMDRYVFQGDWDPSRGALTTVFVETCIWQFANEYRGARRAAVRRDMEEPRGDLGAGEGFEPSTRRWTSLRQGLDPAQVAVDRLELESVLGRLNEREREVLILVGADVPRDEIAARLGLTSGQVDNAIRRGRAKAREWRDRDREDRALVESAQPAESEALWNKLKAWGINDVSEAAAVKEAIDAQRSLYESPQRPALRRPIPGVELNQLDMVLQGFEPELSFLPANWTANNARVCREVLASIHERYPAVGRPEGRRKGLSRDFRALYEALVLVLT